MLNDIKEESEGFCFLDESKETSHRDNENEDDEKEGRMPKQVVVFLSRIWNNLMERKGLLYGMLLGISMGLQLCILKGLSPMSAYQIMFYRSIILLLSVVLILWEKSNSYDIIDMVYYLAYGIFNCLGIVLIYLALGLANVGNVTVISTNGPVPSAILGCIILKESVTTWDMIVFTFNLVGIFLVSKPPFVFKSDHGNPVKSLNEFYGSLLALLGLFNLVLTNIFSRKLAYRENSDPALMTFIPGMTGIAITGVILCFTDSWELPSSLKELLLVLSLGIFSLLCNCFLVLGLQTERVITVCVLETLSVPVAFMVDILVFQSVPDLVSILGAITIVATTVGCLCKP